MSLKFILILITIVLVPFTLGLKYFFEKNKDTPYDIDEQEVIRQYHLLSRGGIQYTDSEVEKILLSATNGNFYHYLKDSSLDQRIPLVAMESQEASDLYDKNNGLSRVYNAIEKISKMDQAYWNSKTEAERNQFLKTPQNALFYGLLLHIQNSIMRMSLSSSELNNLLKKFDMIAPSWIRAALPEFISAVQSRHQANLARDEDSARNLAARGQSGVHFAGLNHLIPTINFLEKLCRQELNPEQSAGDNEQSLSAN